MPGIDPSIIVHNLIVDPTAKPYKQKLRKMHPTIALMIKDELMNLLDVDFIRTIDYPQWLSNIVHVENVDGRIRVCTDFRDINKAFLKDNFPLPNKDSLVDATTVHEMLSLMNGFSRYNQIQIAEEDRLTKSQMILLPTLLQNIL